MESVSHTIISSVVVIMNNCGCMQTEQYQEFPIPESPNNKTNKNIPRLGFPKNATENSLKKKIIQEFCSIFKKLQCGIKQDLKFLLEEISLIDKNKYENNNDFYSQEILLDPVFNELHINLDNITPEQLEKLLEVYKDFVLVVQGPKGDKGETGKSAYEIYLETVEYGHTPLTKFQWLESLKGNTSDLENQIETLRTKVTQLETLVNKLVSQNNGSDNPNIEPENPDPNDNPDPNSDPENPENPDPQPENPEPEPTSKPVFGIFQEVPTAEFITTNIDITAEKPNDIKTIDMTSLNKPTDMYLIYKLNWEVIENDLMVNPIIKDSNKSNIGFIPYEDLPTLTVDGVVYRIADINLGKDIYTIEFL